MGINYRAVGWNRQKRLYDGAIAGLCVLFLLSFISLSLVFNPEVTFETLLIRSSGTLAVVLLHVILAIGPLCRLSDRFLPLLYNRRHLGVTMFVVALVHGGFSLLQFHSLGNVSPFVSVFTSNSNYGSLPDFPFQALGFLALVILLAMAATSHDFWLHNLSPRIWKSLHMLVYVAYALIVMHIMLGVIQFETSPVFFVFVVVGAAVIISLHVVAGVREVKKDHAVFGPAQAGFIKVGDVRNIPENRASVFCLNSERIAVFKTGGRLYAVSNVCKHQLGPLGEGEVVDGCITCPWHGYQYLPQNGQSPPPFKEKVNTYDVQLNGTEVWLNPVAYAEGTARPGAEITKG